MPRQYSMHARAEATNDTRRRLVQAAMSLITDVGAEALTMQNVAERADVALRTVYNHFPSKEALVVEAYDGWADSVQTAVKAVPSEGTPPQRLVWFIEAMYDALAEEGLGASAVLAVSGIKELDARVAAVRKWRRREIAALLRPAERDGTLRLPLKEAVALTFTASSFATWSSLVNESGLSPAAAKALMTHALSAAVFGEERQIV